MKAKKGTKGGKGSFWALLGTMRETDQVKGEIEKLERDCEKKGMGKK